MILTQSLVESKATSFKKGTISRWNKMRNSMKIQMGPANSIARGKSNMAGEEGFKGKRQKTWGIALGFIMKHNNSFPFGDKFCEGEPLLYYLYWDTSPSSGWFTNYSSMSFAHRLNATQPEADSSIISFQNLWPLLQKDNHARLSLTQILHITFLWFFLTKH